MKTKICNTCEKEKVLDEFVKNKNRKDGYHSQCKECNRNKVKIYISNPLNKEARKKYAKNNRDKINSTRRKSYIKNRQKHKDNYEKNKDKINELKRNLRKSEKYKIERRKYDKIYYKDKIKNNPLQRLKLSLRTKINKCFKTINLQKNYSTSNLLGCTFEEFKIYLESKFEPWMTWKNRGLYNGQFNYGWDIDHIVPICTAKTEEEMLKLCHYTNLQPLCSKINRDIKKNKLFF